VTLTVGQRLEWLGVRTDELRSWLDRAWVGLPDWSFDGTPLALGAPWPVRGGVHTLAHPTFTPPAAWPADERRLALDLGGEGLLRITYEDGGEESFGLDAEHRELPLRGGAFALEVAIVARRPFGAPNPEPRVAVARVLWPELELEQFVRRLDLVREAATELSDHAAVVPLLDAARRALAALEWPSATRAYVSRQAGTPDLLNVWELPGDLDPHPPALDGAGALPARGRAPAHGPRPPGPRLALADRGDAAQAPPHPQHRARPPRALPGGHVQPVHCAVLRVAGGGRPGAARARRGGGG
jgi:alpha-mannosidase